MLRNTNYEAKKTGEYKNEGTVNELSGVFSYKNFFPMKKEGKLNIQIFFLQILWLDMLLVI